MISLTRCLIWSNYGIEQSMIDVGVMAGTWRLPRRLFGPMTRVLSSTPTNSSRKCIEEQGKPLTSRIGSNGTPLMSWVSLFQTTNGMCDNSSDGNQVILLLDVLSKLWSTDSPISISTRCTRLAHYPLDASALCPGSSRPSGTWCPLD